MKSSNNLTPEQKIDEILREASDSISRGVVTGTWDKVNTKQQLLSLIQEEKIKACIEEIGHIQAQYGHQLAQTMAGGEWQTIKDRMLSLGDRLQALKQPKEQL